MNKYFKTFILFLLIGFLNTIIFIQYLKGTGLPGGEVGMAPFGIMLASIICLVISLILFSLIEIKYRIDTFKAVLLYQIIYLLVLIFTKTNPFDKQLDSDFQKMYLWIYLISFIVSGTMIFTNIAYKTFKKTN